MSKRKKIAKPAYHFSYSEFDLRSEAKYKRLASALDKLSYQSAIDPDVEFKDVYVEKLQIGSFNPDVVPLHLNTENYYYSCYDQVSEFMHSHFEVFDQFQNDRITELTKELKELQQELKVNRNYKLVARIKSIIANIKDLAYRYISLKEQQISIAKKKLTSGFSRNLKWLFRKLIQFKFKNLDDESHSEVVVKNKTTNYFIVKNIHHDFQGKSHSQFERSYLC